MADVELTLRNLPNTTSGMITAMLEQRLITELPKPKLTGEKDQDNSAETKKEDELAWR